MGSYAESLLDEGRDGRHPPHQHWLSLILDSRLAIVLWAPTIVLIIVRLFMPDEFFGISLTSGLVG